MDTGVQRPLRPRSRQPRPPTTPDPALKAPCRELASGPERLRGAGGRGPLPAQVTRLGGGKPAPPSTAAAPRPEGPGTAGRGRLLHPHRLPPPAPGHRAAPHESPQRRPQPTRATHRDPEDAEDPARSPESCPPAPCTSHLGASPPPRARPPLTCVQLQPSCVLSPSSPHLRHPLTACSSPHRLRTSNSPLPRLLDSLS